MESESGDGTVVFWATFGLVALVLAIGAVVVFEPTGLVMPLIASAVCLIGFPVARFAQEVSIDGV